MRNKEECVCSVCLFRCNICIGFRIIKEMLGLVGSGTPYTGCPGTRSTDCPTRYRTRHFFNNFTTNEDIATKFKADLPHCVRNVKEKNVLLFKFRCNIFIGVRIIKEMPGSVASGTPPVYPVSQNALCL